METYNSSGPTYNGSVKKLLGHNSLVESHYTDYSALSSTYATTTNYWNSLALMQVVLVQEL